MRSVLLFILISTAATAIAQSETLRNVDVIDLSRSGLSTTLILKKIGNSKHVFDTSAKALVELKTAGVSDDVIAYMMEAHDMSVPPVVAGGLKPSPNTPSVGEHLAFSDSDAADKKVRPKTISFEKSSVHPSRQVLEKELLKRKDFRDLNLTILRYKEQADLYSEIGFVSGSLLTHRYVYRIFDRRTGAVIVAGETTSWGSLAENLARHISKRLNTALKTN